MPDVSLNGIEFRITGSADQASKSIEKLTASLTSLKSALNGVGNASTVKGAFASLADGIKHINEAVKGGTAKYEKFADAMTKVATAANSIGGGGDSLTTLANAMQTMQGVKVTATAFNNLASGVEKVAEASSKITAEAIANLEKMVDALSKLSGVDLKGLGSAMNAVRNGGAKALTATPLSAEMQEMISSASQVDILEAKLESLNDAMQRAFNAGDMDKAYGFRMQIIQTEAALEKARAAANSTASAIKEVGDSAKSTKKPLNTLIESLKRIAFYRMIRGAIKAVTQAFKEGLENAYQFSKGVGGDLAKSLDSISTKGLTMKNQLGAAFGGLLQAITPIIQAIISIVTKLASALSMLFGLLGGTGKYLAAKDAWTEWGDAAAGAGGAAKKALEYLAPFDELNVLPDQSSGGGGGGSATPYGDMFSEQTIGGWGDLAKNISQFVVDAFSSATEWVKEVDWEQFGRSIVQEIADFFTNYKFADVAESIATFLGHAIAAVANFTYGLVDELNDLCTKIINYIVQQLKKDRNGDDKVTLGEILENAIDLVIITPLKWVDDNIIKPFWDALTDGLKHPHGESGGEATLVWESPTAFLHDVMGLPTDQEIVDWVMQGINDIVNEVTRFFTGGTSMQEIVEALDDGWPLVEAWFKDLPTKFKAFGINTINAFKSEILGGINRTIEDINNSGLAQWLGIHFDPIKFEMTPEIPEEELTANYDAAKSALEAKSKESPVSINAKAIFKTVKDSLTAAQKTIESEAKIASATVRSGVTAVITSKGQIAIASVNSNVNPEIPSTGTIYDAITSPSFVPPSVETKANFTSTIKSNLTDAQKTITSKANIASAAVKDGVTAVITSKGKVASATVNSDVKPVITSTAGILDAVTSPSFVPPEINATAAVTDVKKDSNGRVKTTFNTPTMSVMAQVNSVSDGLSASQKSINATANFTSINRGWNEWPWVYTYAWFTAIGIEKSLRDSNGNLKINATANITRATGRVNLNVTDVMNAKGGVFKSGVWSSIPQYAGGTARAHGSLFIAGEAGPEVVGHIGGRTEVLNRSQLAATMYSAVTSALASLRLVVSAPTATSASADGGDTESVLYRAFRRALDETDFGGDIELDGQTLYSAMVNRNRANTRMTGVNAFA